MFGYIGGGTVEWRVLCCEENKRIVEPTLLDILMW
jgi:hypothetical protein